MNLFGLESAIDLVREFMERPERDGRPRSRRQPVLIFIGPRGSGKTALVMELERRLERKVPYARVDFGRDSASTRAVLTDVAFALNRPCEKYGQIGFPRFILGELIMAETLDLADRKKARLQVERTVEAHRSIDTLSDFLQKIASKRGIDATATDHGLHLLLKGLISRPGGRRVVLGKGLDWYRHRDRGFSDDPFEALVDLNRASKRTHDNLDRRVVEEVVWAAFLADLRDGFEHSRRAPYRSLSCVLLLDNADTLSGPASSKSSPRRACAIPRTTLIH